jgi:hypothetical protein
VRGYYCINVFLFELTKNGPLYFCRHLDVKRHLKYWNALVKAPILVQPKFIKAFILVVDWSIKGVNVIMSQWKGCNEKVVAYASYKSLSPIQKHFHPMEGQCYALIWGTMHLKQYLHQNQFTLKTNHKPLKWLAIVSDVY